MVIFNLSAEVANKSKTFGNKTERSQDQCYSNNRHLALSSRLVQTSSRDDVYGHVTRDTCSRKSIFLRGGA